VNNPDPQVPPATPEPIPIVVTTPIPVASRKLLPSNSTFASVGLGVPVATVIAWLLNTFANVVVPGEVQAAMGALVSALVGYFFIGGQNADTE